MGCRVAYLFLFRSKGYFLGRSIARENPAQIFSDLGFSTMHPPAYFISKISHTRHTVLLIFASIVVNEEMLSMQIYS